jgi:hypothetical protein
VLARLLVSAVRRRTEWRYLPVSALPLAQAPLPQQVKVSRLVSVLLPGLVRQRLRG